MRLSHGRRSALPIIMKGKILILDDDEQLGKAYKEFLADRGYEVDCAQELEEAETLLAHFPYCLVITDLRLNKFGFGGLDLVRHVRESSKKTRVIVLTGYGWPEIRSEAMSQQVEAFIRKPVALQELADTIDMYVGADA